MLLDDIGNYLQSEGIGTIGTDIFLGLLPDTPDNCVALLEVEGKPPYLAYGVDEERPVLQVKVRNTQYAAGRSKIEDVVTLLHVLHNTTLGGKRYLSIVAAQSPYSMGYDTSDLIVRHLLVVNFNITKER